MKVPLPEPEVDDRIIVKRFCYDYVLHVLERDLSSLREEYNRLCKIKYTYSEDNNNEVFEAIKHRMKELENGIRLVKEFNL
jgi:hypothetical protein